MLKVQFTAHNPFWLNLLPGVRVQIRPVLVAAMLLARTAAAEALRASGNGGRDVLNGTPCLNGTRTPVHDIAAMIANGDEKSPVGAWIGL
jgi:hypothetical protein